MAGLLLPLVQTRFADLGTAETALLSAPQQRELQLQGRDL